MGARTRLEAVANAKAIKPVRARRADRKLSAEAKLNLAALAILIERAVPARIPSHQVIVHVPVELIEAIRQELKA